MREHRLPSRRDVLPAVQPQRGDRRPARRHRRPALRRLEDSTDIGAREFVAGLGLRDGGRVRPRVLAVMIASADGRATIEGKSVKLGHPADRALLREMRTGADAVLAGATTIRAEGYATLLDEDQRAHREALGLPPHPVIATVSRRLELSAGDAPVFTEDGVPVAVYTEAEGGIDGSHADVIRLDQVDFASVLADLGARYGVRSVSCEGGPRLLRELVAQDCLDDLLLTVAPLLVAGEGPTPLTGDALSPAPKLSLAAVHRADDHLFLHYTR